MERAHLRTISGLPGARAPGARARATFQGKRAMRASKLTSSD
ncbi:hypothetical protein BIWAKO_05840 [Bosea sp. BIWAKO-01]|nr:hypothetical protein BIWAKO_05840 [Bosea sp. BIWAKO-01]